MTTNPSTSFGPRPLRALLAGWAVLLLAAAPLAGQATDTTAQQSGASATTTGTTVRTDTTPQKADTTETVPSDSQRIAALRDSLRVARERLEKPGGWGEFPGSATTAVLAIILLGALGALAGDLVADGGRLDRWKRDDTGWLLGFPGRLLIGVVTALIVVLGMAQPDGSWPTLIATALGVGAASEAVLLGIMASWKTRAAEQDTRQTRAAGETKMRGLGVQMKLLNARQAEPVMRAQAAPDGAATDDFDAMVDGLVEQAVDEFRAETAVRLP